MLHISPSTLPWAGHAPLGMTFAIRYSLFAIRYSLFAIRYSLFAIHYSLFLKPALRIDRGHTA